MTLKEFGPKGVRVPGAPLRSATGQDHLVLSNKSKRFQNLVGNFCVGGGNMHALFSLQPATELSTAYAHCFTIGFVNQSFVAVL